jgi:hypothetical protein
MLKAFTRRWNYNTNHETGSDAEYGGSWNGDYTGAQYCDAGHEVPVQTVASAFYGVNAARNNGADIEPIPITPVRQQNWPGMQIQLRNGWGTTSFGRKLSYDNYLRLLTDSATKNRHYLLPNPSGLGPAAQRPGPAPGNVQSMIATTAGAQPQTPGGPGFLASGVDLTGRNYYG